MRVGWAMANAGLRAANRRIPRFLPSAELVSGSNSVAALPNCTTCEPQPRYFGAQWRKSAHAIRP